MNFVEDHGIDRAEEFARLRREQKIQGFGSGYEDVGRVAQEAGAFGRRRITGADRDGRFVEGKTQALRGLSDSNQWRAEIPFDVHGQGFNRRYINDAAASLVRRRDS